MERSIRFDKVTGITFSPVIKEGVLTGKFSCEVAVTPLNVARLLNFQKQGVPLNMVIENLQCSFDFEFADPDATEGVAVLSTAKDEKASAGPALYPLTFKDIHVLTIAPDTVDAEGNPLPRFTITIDSFSGSGNQPAEAIIACLLTAGLASETLEKDMSYKYTALTKILTNSYASNTGAQEVLNCLVENTFDHLEEYTPEETTADDNQQKGVEKPKRRSRKKAS